MKKLALVVVGMTLNRVILDEFLFPESCQYIVFPSLGQIDATIRASRGGDFFFFSYHAELLLWFGLCDFLCCMKRKSFELN